MSEPYLHKHHCRIAVGKTPDHPHPRWIYFINHSRPLFARNRLQCSLEKSMYDSVSYPLFFTDSIAESNFSFRSFPLPISLSHVLYLLVPAHGWLFSIAMPPAYASIYTFWSRCGTSYHTVLPHHFKEEIVGDLTMPWTFVWDNHFDTFPAALYQVARELLQGFFLSDFPPQLRESPDNLLINVDIHQYWNILNISAPIALQIHAINENIGVKTEVAVSHLLKNGKHRFSQTGVGSWAQNRRGSSPPRKP